MILGPLASFQCVLHPVLANIELIVPGVETYAWLYPGRWCRWKGEEAQHFLLNIALHSAWRLEEELKGANIAYAIVHCDDTSCLSRNDLLAQGQALAAAAVERGELRKEAKPTPYQLVGMALAKTRPWALKIWRPGSGKTKGGLLDIMVRSGPALILCPSKARKEWKSSGMASASRFTHLETFRALPEGSRRKGDPERIDDYNFERYLERMKEIGKRAILVLGIESLRDQLPLVRRLQPVSLLIDEIHELGSADRWEAIAKQTGGRWFIPATTETGEKTTAVAAMEVSRLGSVQFREGLSGTPLDDGRPRRAWAILDLLSPGGFGPYSRFKVRYCDFKIENGYPNDRGSSHVDELKRRCWPMLHDVPYVESHGALPPLRMEVDYVPRNEQNPPDAFTAEFKRLSKLKFSGSSDRKIHALTREAALAEACSRIRKVVLARAEEFLKGGGKVVILMTRKKMIESWAEKLRSTCPDVFLGHGDVSDADRDEAVERYAVHPGPCVLIGTFQAIGTSKDGMQYTDLAIIAQVPEKPGMWIQGRGRFERIRDESNPFVVGVRAPILWVPLAEGSAAEAEVSRLTRKFGPIEQFTESPELREQAEALDGISGEAGEDLLAGLVAKLSGNDPEEEE